MDANGHEWTRMDTNGHEWTRMDTNGREWTRMDGNGREDRQANRSPEILRGKLNADLRRWGRKRDSRERTQRTQKKSHAKQTSSVVPWPRNYGGQVASSPL